VDSYPGTVHGAPMLEKSVISLCVCMLLQCVST